MTDSGSEDGTEWDSFRVRDEEEMEFFTELALHETERWIQAVTRKKFEYPEDFRRSLSNGILLCELLNCIEPGLIKRINKLPGAIAGLDNLNVFLSVCEKTFGLKKSHLFDPSDLEDLSQRAIADEKEGLLKQESDRRATNVAVCIYWLAKSVNEKFKGPTLDTSAFRALVYTHGTKRDSIIADECYNGLPFGKEKNGLETLGESHKENSHFRGSSYDSLESVERESVSSFDDLDSSGNMPVRSDMREMRKYGSTSSLNNRDLRFSMASQDSMYSDNKDDSMYTSSPDVSHAHTRSSSTDSAEGGIYSNHSRQSSGSMDYPTRKASLTANPRKMSATIPDPLQFVKLKGAAELAEQAKRQMQVAQETNIMRGKTNSTVSFSSEEPDWKSNLSNWKKQRRKSAHLPLGDTDNLDEQPEEDNRRHKTFRQIMSEKENRSGRKSMNVYPMDDEPAITIERTTRTMASPKSKPAVDPLVPKLPEVAPWAKDSSGEDNSHSDSENHQSGDNDSVFSSSDKSSTPNKILSDDESLVKNKSSSNISANKARPLQTQKSQDSVLQKWQNSVNESHRSNENKNRVNVPNSNSKIKNITQAFEVKEKEVQNTPAKSRRSELNNSKTKSLDLSSSKFASYEPTPLSPTTPQALLPREQRFGHDRSVSDPYIRETDQLSVAQSATDRYLQNVSPIHTNPTTKAFPASCNTQTVALPANAMPRPAAKPSKDKIAMARTLFEQSGYHQEKEFNPEKSDKNAVKDTDATNHMVSNMTDDDAEESKRNDTEASSVEKFFEEQPADVPGFKEKNRQRTEADIEQELHDDSVENMANQENARDDTIENEDRFDCSANTSQIAEELVSETLESVTNQEQAIVGHPENQKLILSENFKQSVLVKESGFHGEQIDYLKQKDFAHKEYDDFGNETQGHFDDIHGPEDGNLNESIEMNSEDGIPELPASKIPDIVPSHAAAVQELSRDGSIGDDDFADMIRDVGSSSSVEKIIRISQRKNNERGFGFVLDGGIEKKKPVTVQRVNLGSAADVQEVKQGDELLEINGRDVTTLTLAQVQGIVDLAVKKGQIELRVKRAADEDAYDSMEDEDNQSSQNNNNNNNQESKMDTQSDSSLSTDQTSLEDPPVKNVHQIPVKTDETGKPRLMDQLIGEQQRETNNNEKNARTRSPVTVERIQMETTAATHSMPARQLSETPKDISGPSNLTLTEERSTLLVHKSPPAWVKTQQEPESSISNSGIREEPSYDRRHDNASTASDDSSSSIGPPAALLRWQRRRPQSSEYNNTAPVLEDKEKEREIRFSSTLPYKSVPFTFNEAYAKDDSEMDKVTKNFVETVSMSKPLEVKPQAFQFNDSARLDDWQQREEQKRKPDATVSFPRIELNIPKEENLTPQKVAHVDAPKQSDFTIPHYEGPLSPQEKFERDQQKIRMQYEEDKRRAREAEKHRQEHEKKTLDSDRFLQSMESQILQTKSEAANHSLLNNQPIKSSVTEPRFSSEPMTIKLSSNMPARPLLIDPRNQQEDFRDSKQPEYSFRVDLPKTESAPPLRTLRQTEETNSLAREREKIEEEKRKLEEERQQFKEEQERQKREQEDKLRREREQLQRKEEEIAREKALLEAKRNQNNSFSSPYQSSVSPSLYSPSSSTSSSTSHSPHSPPTAYDSKSFDHSGGKKQPPPTAPKPDKGVKEKARLTREDLLAMNRKATPLTKPDPSMEMSPSQSEPLSPTTREAPSKAQLHSLNAVPKQKFRSSAPWMKEDDTSSSVPQNANTLTQNERPFVIGKRSDLIHTHDSSNPNDHWLVREAEKRRLAERDNAESVTARAGPTKPSQSSLVNRFRGDIEPPPRQNNRYSYPSYSDVQDTPSPRPLSTSGSNLRQYDRSPDQGITTKFSARTQPSSYSGNPSMSQTLPPSFSFNARTNGSATAARPPRSLTEDRDPVIAVSGKQRPPRSLTEDRDPVIAVSGKQKCSHCGEELGFGAAMVIESLGLYYHVQCFRCCVCHAALGNGSEGADVRVRVDKLHCKNCYSNDEAGLKFSKV
ncbi:LIM and calponin homology domains-containing protein 1-like isoform X3 [Dreissena polymorpha]|uniref:LIM and calponin homology domains-containing protein 1-like isoform X3 n=1 Tax=Dreissena polymorpha TaxID=45954 RepID=UPI002264E547|nr:LIM and calponin homology domains-containing protein 1-like isoform X3 [Dreissena polymorpha]